MARYIIPVQNGTFTTESGGGARLIGGVTDSANHQLTFSFSGATPTAGILQIYAKAEGSDVYEQIPDSTVDYASPQSVLFTFRAQHYQFVASGVTGSGELSISDLEL